MIEFFVQDVRCMICSDNFSTDCSFKKFDTTTQPGHGGMLIRNNSPMQQQETGVRNSYE